MSEFPHEFFIADVYMPPLLVASILGILATNLTVGQIEKRGLARYFFYPPLVYVALVVIYTGLIGIFIVKV